MSAASHSRLPDPRWLAGDPRAGYLAVALTRLIERGGQLSALPGLYSRVAEELERLIDYERLSISVLDDRLGKLRVDFSRTSLSDVPPVGSYFDLDDSIAGEVFRTRQPVTHAIGQPPVFSDDQVKWERGIRQIAVAPIIVDEVAYGTIAISSVEAARYTNADLWILTAFADLLSMMVSGITLRYEAQHKRRDAEFLARLSRLMGGSRDPAGVSQALADLLAPELDKSCLVFLATDEGRFRVAAVRAADPAQTARVSYIGTSLCELPRWRTTELVTRAGPGVPLIYRRTGEGQEAGLYATLRQWGQYGITEAVTMPLFAGADLLGAITTVELGNGDPEGAARPPLTSTGLNLLRQAAEQAAPALVNARLHESLQRAYHESETLRLVGQDLARSQDTHQALRLACRAVFALFNADYAGVVRRVANGDLQWESVIGNRTTRHLDRPFSPSLDDPIREGRVLISRDFPHDAPAPADAFPVSTAEGLRALLMVPIMVAGKSIGGLAVGFRERRPIRDSDIRNGQALAQTLAVAVQTITRDADER